MKRIITLATILVFQLPALSSDSIVFRQVSHEQAFELARKEKKAVFLYFHFDGCGACVKMEKTAFIDKPVAAFYNAGFICLEVNTRKGEGIETNRIYNVQLHPTFLFLDSNRKELHKIVGVFSPEEFASQAKRAISDTGSLSWFRGAYQNGRRDPGFLYDYCYRLRDADELDSLPVMEYLGTQRLEELQTEKNIRFIYEFAIHRGNLFIPFGSPAFNFMNRHRSAFSSYFDARQVQTRLMFIIQGAVYQSIETRDSARFWKTLEALKEFDTGGEYNFMEMDGRITMWTSSRSPVLSAKLYYFDTIGDSVQYNRVLKEYTQLVWNDHDALNSLAWDFFERSDNRHRLETALRCAERSIELKSYYANNDTYAWLLYKTGNYPKAMQVAERAIELARRADVDYSGTAELVQKLKEKSGSRDAEPKN